MLALLIVKAATEATTTKPNLTSMTSITHHSPGLNRQEGRDREPLLIKKTLKQSYSKYEWPNRLNSLHIFSLNMGWRRNSAPARAGEHTPPEHVASLIHPILALQLPICVYPLAKTKSCITQVAFISLCPAVWYYLVADKISIC